MPLKIHGEYGAENGTDDESETWLAMLPSCKKLWAVGETLNRIYMNLMKFIS